MKLKSYLLEGIKITNTLINDILFMCETRTKETYFTRIGKNIMAFKSIVTFILNFVKKSLQLELDDFFNGINDTSFTITKQAFSEAIQKRSHEAFIKMSDKVIEWFTKILILKSIKTIDY